VRVGKRPAHVGDGAMVGAGWADKIWVLSLTRPVARAQHT
jgi:hypothetical protein